MKAPSKVHFFIWDLEGLVSNSLAYTLTSKEVSPTVFKKLWEGSIIRDFSCLSDCVLANQEIHGDNASLLGI